MIRRILLFLVLSTAASMQIMAWNPEGAPVKRALPFGKGSTLLSYSGFLGLYQLHEFKAEYFFHDRWSLMYRAGYSFRKNTEEGNVSSPHDEILAPAGLSMCCLVGATAACEGLYLYDTYEWMLYMPDGVAYHIPLGGFADLSPYVIPTGISLQRRGDNHRQLVYAPSAGIRILYPLGPHVMLNLEQRVRHTGQGMFESSPGVGISGWF